MESRGLCGIFSILLVGLLWVAPGNGEVYSSAADMMEVFKLERELVGIMDNFAAKLQKKLDKINSYLEVRKASEFGQPKKKRRPPSSRSQPSRSSLRMPQLGLR